MDFKIIRGKKYKWAAARSTKAKANALKEKYNKSGIVHAVVVSRKLGSKTALVPTVYEIWVRPTAEGQARGYALTSKILEIFIRTHLN